VGLCRLLAWNGMSALRFSLPFMTIACAELRRADYIVSANIGRTVQVCRQPCSTRGAPSRGWPKQGTTGLAYWVRALVLPVAPDDGHDR